MLAATGTAVTTAADATRAATTTAAAAASEFYIFKLCIYLINSSRQS